MRIQTVVQTHPARAHLLPGLLAALPEGTQVVTDPDPGNPQRSPWRTYLACLNTLEPDATHLLILQDDIEPCQDFAKAVALVARRHPSAPVALFCPGLGNHARRVLDACRDGKRYAELPYQNTFIPVVATLWPRASVESILAWWETASLPEVFTADDGVLGKWMEAIGARVLATVPSLCEHPDHERSLVGKLALGGRNPSRCAACWTGPDMSALDLDW